MEIFDYHGNTTIERVRARNGRTLRRDWLIFDAVEEASAYFHENC